MDYGPGYNFSCIYYFCHGLCAKWTRKPKVVIHLDKSLSMWYSNEDELNATNVELTVVINLTANKYVSILGNAVVWLKMQACIMKIYKRINGTNNAVL